jgi:hypothetical protein
MKLWICCKHISEIMEITTCRETPSECHTKCPEQNGAQFEQLKKNLLFLLFVLLNKYCFHDYKNVFISNSWPVTNKVLLIPIRIRN